MPADFGPAETGAVEIRTAARADFPAIGRVRRESWFAAYAHLIEADLIDRATAVNGRQPPQPSWRSTIVALAVDPDAQVSAGAVGAQARQVVGFASYGPERTVDSAIPPPPSPEPGERIAIVTVARSGGPLTPAGLAGQTGELYALYVAPRWWSTGTGRALTDRVLGALRAAGYRRAVLWTLTGNARARRFYAKAGFAPDGFRNILTGLGGVEELRYARDL